MLMSGAIAARFCAVKRCNSVDATYRADLRELNELNFARFDAKLEQRVAHVEAKLDQRFAYLDAKIDRAVAQLEAKVEQRFAEMKTELLKWMFLFWATNLAALVALAAR